MSNKYLDFNGLSYYNSIISPPLASLINYNSKNVLNNTAHKSGARGRSASPPQPPPAHRAAL